MIKLAVIADDLTGCNATAALFAQKGWDVCSVLSPQASIAPILSTRSAVVWNSASRILAPEEAGVRLRTMTSDILAVQGRFPDGAVDLQLAKRIDSTLRGPMGREMEAMLAVMRPETIAVLVPAFPSAGRTSLSGSVYVHGVPVHQTEAGHDPYTPVTTSNVLELLQSQTRLPLRLIDIQHVSSRERLRRELQRALSSGAKVVVCDAATDEHIRRLAEVWAALEVPVLPVDPGPFTAAYVSARLATNKRILVVSGSVMETARKQVDVLQDRWPCGMVPLDVVRLCDPQTASAYRREVVQKLSEYLRQYAVVGIRSDSVPLSNPGAGASIASAIAKLVLDALAVHRFDGLYLSGGEIAYAVLRAMGAEALRVVEEIVPLCVLSQIAGGPYQGMSVVTKGGAVGDETAVLRSVQTLLYRAKPETESVRRN